MKDLMEARAKLDEALGPLKQFDKLKDVESLTQIIQSCDKLLYATEHLKLVLDEISLVKSAKSIVDSMTMKDFLTFCEKSKRWRSVTTGRYVKAPQIADRLIKTLEEHGAEKLLDHISTVVQKFTNLDGWTLVRMCAISFIPIEKVSAEAIEKVSEAVSGTSYIARSVKNYAGKVAEIAKSIAASEKVVATIAKLNFVMDMLMGVLTVGQIAEGIYTDASSACGCCEQADSAMINLQPAARERVLYIQNETFHLVFPTLPWNAVDAVQTSATVALALDFRSHVLHPNQERATRSSVSNAAFRHPSDDKSCLLSAYLNLTHWAVQEFKAEAAAHNALVRDEWNVNSQIEELNEKRLKIQQLQDEWCIFTCGSINQEIQHLEKSSCGILRRVHDTLKQTNKNILRLRARVKKASDFLDVMIQMKNILGDQAPELPRVRVELLRQPQFEVQASCTTCFYLLGKGICFTSTYHINTLFVLLSAWSQEPPPVALLAAFCIMLMISCVITIRARRLRSETCTENHYERLQGRVV